MQNRFLLVLSLLTVFFLACKEENVIPFCEVNTPTEELPWLREFIVKLEASKDTLEFNHTLYLKQYTYLNVPYFVQGSCCTDCFYVPTHFTCEGDTVNFLVDVEDVEAYKAAFDAGKILWQGGQCSF